VAKLPTDGTMGIAMLRSRLSVLTGGPRRLAGAMAVDALDRRRLCSYTQSPSVPDRLHLNSFDDIRSEPNKPGAAAAHGRLSASLGEGPVEHAPQSPRRRPLIRPWGP